MVKYSTDWFTQNSAIWTAVLQDLKNKPIRALEIGTYEGRSAIWLLNNILINKEAHLDVVDSWNGGGELDDHDWPVIEKNFKDNIAPYKDQVTVYKQDSTEYLRKCDEMYDFIYIDGGHFAPQALIDGVLSHIRLKPGGIIIFDDYLIGGLLHTPRTPKTGIDAFMECFAEDYEWLTLGYQAILRKSKDAK